MISELIKHGQSYGSKERYNGQGKMNFSQGKVGISFQAESGHPDNGNKALSL